MSLDDKDRKEVDNILDRKMGFFIEQMNDQFAKVLEAVDHSTGKIPAMSERLEKVEHDMTAIRLAMIGIPGDLKLLKIRTEKLDDITSQLEDHETRIAGIERTS